MKLNRTASSFDTVQSMSLQNELRETIYVFDCHQFPQFILQTHELFRIKGSGYFIIFHRHY